MPKNNGTTLGGSEQAELKLLVEARKDGETFPVFAQNRLDPEGNDEFPDRNLVQIYHSLEKKGMITGFPRDNAFTFVGLNQCGIDWINDYEKQVADDAATEKSRRRHDYCVAAFGYLISAIAGVLIEYFTGVADTIIHSIASIAPLLLQLLP